MKVSFSLKFILFSSLALAGTSLSAQDDTPRRPPRRLTSRIDGTTRFRLSGNTKPMLALAHDQGAVNSGMELDRMSIHFTLTEAQKEDLELLLRLQQTPGSDRYHKFLTPEEFGARFGVNDEDLSRVRDWLSANGFSDLETARSRTFISFSGTAALAESAFQTSIHQYKLDNETHYANTSDPRLPQALNGMVRSIRGLHDFRLKPRGVKRATAHFTSSISGSHFLTPDDFATIYGIQPLYQSGLLGTGVKIAIPGQSDIRLTDVQAFRAAAGLTAKDPQVIVTGRDPGIVSDDESESTLDVEWAGGIGRDATIVFVTSRDVTRSESYIIDNNVAPILSISYGLCETDYSAADNATELALYQQANAQGITVVAASGDSGPADCDSGAVATHGLSVDVPSSFPNVTGIGGTLLSEGGGSYWGASNNSYGGSALSYIPESVWNDTSSAGLSASGGGASQFNSKPLWQTGTGVPNDGFRDTPDLSFAASPGHDGYLICVDGRCISGFRDGSQNLNPFGGTSAGTPSFAGILALLIQKNGGMPLGNINPNLYAVAAQSPDAFHDVTTGSNSVPCQIGTKDCTNGAFGYAAGVGYDQATGLGSVNASRLASDWFGTPATSNVVTQGPLGFVPINPCRVADTRNTAGQFGGPKMAAGATREFDLPAGVCGLPSDADAYALNVTVVPDTILGYLSIYASGQTAPQVSTLNSDGRVKANAAIVPAGTNGGVNVYVSHSSHVILDITGYFKHSSGLTFFPVTPCRVADTRGSKSSLGGPSLAGGNSRTLPVLSSTCGVPATAAAYSLNFTAVPQAALGYFNAWPAGQAQPPTSLLNTSSASVTANAAIVPAGSNGDITVFASDNTDLIVDVNGYFAPTSAGGLWLYTLPPCRAVDTRFTNGAQPFVNTVNFNLAVSGCGLPTTGQALVLNATVVPPGILGYLSLWPAGQPTPIASTLNADSGVVTSNMALVPDTAGVISAYASQTTNLILDLSGYFAPLPQ